MMRKICNPFLEIPHYDCFGCAPSNPLGLKMEFFEDGDEIVSLWKPSPHYQGYGNILHGGIIASLLDEVSSWAVFIKLKTSGVTQHIGVTYHKPVIIKDEPLRLTSRVVSIEKNIAAIEAKLFFGETLGSEAQAQFFVFPQKIAEKKFCYPPYERFFEPGDINN